jgi:hypothetical protein
MTFWGRFCTYRDSRLEHINRADYTPARYVMQMQTEETEGDTREKFSSRPISLEFKIESVHARRP